MAIMQKSSNTAPETTSIRLDDLLRAERVASRAGVASKKRAIELISELLVAGQEQLTQAEVFSCLLERERLGSTGLGHGAAIPHGRLAGLQRATCAFLKLSEGVEFDASDEQPVDLICGLLVPEGSTNEHLNILAMLAEMFSDGAFCDRVRQAKTGREIYDLLVSWRRASRGKTATP